jgi:hypothetical protein
MPNKSIIFAINQVIKRSKYTVPEIANQADISEDSLRLYMNSRVIPLEKFSALVNAFVKLNEPELAEQLLLQLTGFDWCFYYVGKNKDIESDPDKISRELSILIGKVNRILENLGNLDRYEKLHAMIHLQKMISIIHDLMRLIDNENNFLKLWS